MDMRLKLFFFYNGDRLIALKRGYGLIAYSFFLNEDGLLTLKHGDEFLAFIYFFFKEDGLIASK